MCVYVGVPIRNNFVKKQGGYSGQVSHNQKMYSSPRSNKCKGFSILTKKIKQNTKAFSKPLLGTKPTHMRHKTNQRKKRKTQATRLNKLAKLKQTQTCITTKKTLKQAKRSNHKAIPPKLEYCIVLNEIKA